MLLIAYKNDNEIDFCKDDGPLLMMYGLYQPPLPTSEPFEELSNE